MKRSKIIYPLLAALLIFVAAVFAVNSHSSKQASVFSLPDLSGTTNIAKSQNQPASSLKDLNNAFVDIAKQTNPTVVTIRVKQTIKVDAPENPFFRFFGDQRQMPQKRTRRGIGSGVIVSKDGYILTNNHVVHNADDIEVTLGTNDTYSGKVVGTDPKTDIAVVKIDANDLPAIKMGDSNNLQVGSLVMAIGTPEALSHSVSMGIVSAKNRHINLIEDGQGYEDYIQTDAAINPGNSGGAMVNMNGELVGINAAIASQSGGNEGIGFAVPINLARSVMKSLIKNGTITHAEIGIYVGNVTDALARGMNLKDTKGIIINSIKDNSAAERAGLKQGDVIKTMDGADVGSSADFRTTIATSKPGKKIKLGIVRDGKNQTVNVTLGKLESDNNSSSDTKENESIESKMGFRVHELTGRIAQQLDLQAGQQGVLVSSVAKDSKAASQGLVKGDVITKVNKQSVDSISDFKKAINKLSNKKNPVLLLQVVNRQGMNQFIAFEL